MNKFLQFAIQLIKDRDYDNLIRIERPVVDEALVDVLAGCVTRIHALEERLANENHWRRRNDADLCERIEAIEAKVNTSDE